MRYSHRVLCLTLDHGIRTRRLAVNVARGVRLPRLASARERILTVAEVEALADRLGTDGYLDLAMAFLGLRWSEVAGLRVADLDLSRGRVRIVERATVVGWGHGRLRAQVPSLAPTSPRSALWRMSSREGWLMTQPPLLAPVASLSAPLCPCL